MPGAGMPDVEPLSAGTTAQPIVSPLNPVITPDSVSQLVDAFRKGAIGAADIQDRIGAEAMADKRAHIQQLSEYVSPDAIQSRLSQLQATGAQAQLQTASAQAQQPLIQPQADLLATQIGQQKAATVYGQGGIQAIQSIGPWYGISMDQFKEPDGTFNFQKAASEGNKIAAKNAIINNWFQYLAPASTQEITDAAGNKHVAQLNAAGQDVSKPRPELGYPGSPAYWYYVKQLNELMPDTHPLRGAIPAVHPGDETAPVAPGVPVSSGPPRAVVTPQTEGRFRAEYADYLKKQGADDPEAFAAKASPETIQSFVDGQYPVTTAPAQPVIAPIATPAAPSPTEVTGAAGGPIIAPAQTPAQQRSEVLESRAKVAALPDVNEYYKALPTFIKFADSAKRAPLANNGPTDLGLAENYSKMHDPQSTIREFKFDALKEVIPLLERFKDAKALIDREHIFPPKVRQAIIEDGLRLADATEQGIRPSLVSAEKTLPGTLNADQQAIVSGIPFSKRVGLDHVLSPSTVSPAASTAVKLPSGKTVRFIPD